MPSTTVSQLPQAQVPFEATRFSAPPSLAWVSLFAGVLSFGMGSAAVSLAVAQSEPIFAFLSPLGFFFCAFCLRSFVLMRNSAAVSEAGVWYIPRRSAPAFIPWIEVASVRADDTMQRLVLKDVSGTRTIRLEYQLQNFSQLREYVVAHTSAVNQRQAETQKVFHRTWINKIIFSVFGTILAVPLVSILLIDHDPFPAAILSPLIALAVGVVLWDPTRVLIEPTGIVIRSLAWRRTIPYASIQQITLSDTNDRGNVWAVVTILRKKGRPIKLFRFREGSIVLHDALELAWRSATGVKND